MVVIYAFVDVETEEPVDVAMEAGEAPKFGEEVEMGGRRLRRVVTLPQKTKPRSWEFKAWSQPEWAEGADYYTPTGTPCFNSRESVQKYLDQQNRLAERDGQGETGGEILGYDGKTTV